MKLKVELNRSEYTEFLKLIAHVARYLDRDPATYVNRVAKKYDMDDELGTLKIRPHTNGVIMEGDLGDDAFGAVCDGLRKCLNQLPKFRVVQNQVEKVLKGFLGNFNF